MLHGHRTVYERPKCALATPASTSPPTPELESKPEPTIRPYICHAFVIQHSVLYMGDVSHIPESAWALLGRGADTGGDHDGPMRTRREYSAVVLDCLRPATHVSHFGLAQSVSAARRLGATRTYLLGFGHEIGFDEYARVGEILGGAPVGDAPLSSGEKKCLDVLEKEKGEPLWLRPAHDGLRVIVDGLDVRDETFDA